ncbi:MAG: hypothetical protein A2Y43_00620 [Tenericutes bacterium GWA2_38_26]|nr:MAG: hypothetical protein A2Y43_00620 [Tenericutes bacterium GWA2_38_26]
MTRNMFVKLTLMVFVVGSLFSLIMFISSIKKEVIAYDLNGTWVGDNLDLKPLMDGTYQSGYSPFKSISGDIEAITTGQIYVIEDADDLYDLSELSKGMNAVIYMDQHYVLGNHIDYYDTVISNVSHRFHPIGFNSPFTGTFDGRGFEISNLYFQTILDAETYNDTYGGLIYFSMFSVLGESGIVKNLGLINPIIIQPIEWGNMVEVSPLVGLNQGLIQNVYIIDTRNEAAGYHVEGSLHLSGLVAINHGVIDNAYISTEHVKSASVYDILSTSVLIHQNTGVLNQVYYDEEIYKDLNTSTEFGTGLLTSAFQNHENFSSAWFFTDHYFDLVEFVEEQILVDLNQIYPMLRGLSFENHILYIDEAIDLIYMNELLNVSGYFRSSHYQVIKDIDMNEVSSDAYKAANVAFNGIFDSSLRSEQTSLYIRDLDSGGDSLYHSIIGLRIKKASVIGNYASYALFPALFGTVRNLNLIQMHISPMDLEDQMEKTKVLVGSIAGLMNGGTILNTHVDLNTLITKSLVPITKLYVGGLVGEGSGTIHNSTTRGTMNHEIQTYQALADQSATGGIIAHAQSIHLSEIISDLSIAGLGFDQVNNGTAYLGGLVGDGTISSASELIFKGELISHLDSGYIETLFAGGVFGLITSQEEEIYRIYNLGDIQVEMTNPMTLKLAGVVNIDGINQDENADFRYSSITNGGIITMNHPSGNVFSTAELQGFNVDVSSVVNSTNIIGRFNGLFNNRSIGIDLSIIDTYAAVLNITNGTGSTLTQSYNQGNITVSSQNTLTQSAVKISGNVLGSNIGLTHLRNEGNIIVDILHQSLLVQSTLYVTGLLETLSQDQVFNDGFNGGNIEIEKLTALPVYYDIYVSGIAYKNENTNYYQLHDIEAQSISNVNVHQGAMDNVLNSGNLSVKGDFYGSSRISGIVLFNLSLMTSAVNLGDIDNKNDTTINLGEVESAGIVYSMIGQYARIKDSANNGKIVAASKSTTGYAHASGIALRNDRLENGTYVGSGSLNRFAKILYSINYGDIYAFSATIETGYTITGETRSKASGIFSIGMLSVIDVINYGNVYSKYLASGIIGFLKIAQFGVIGFQEVYFANAMNYGKIREIVSYTDDFAVNMTTIPARTVYNAFASTIGKIHTGTTSWDILSATYSNTYPIDKISFGYLVNFDELSDMVGNAPTARVDSFSLYFGLGNPDLVAIISRMATLKQDDNSKEPFTLFYLSGWPKSAYYGRAIPSFKMSDETGGIFNQTFPNVQTGTDQYLKDYFSYIKADNVSDFLISKLNSNRSIPYTGIYALSDSAGTQNGTYIPDQLDLTLLNPRLDGETQDLSWLGDDQVENSIYYQLHVEMRQMKSSYATSIYDLELVQTDVNGEVVPNGLKLSHPEISNDRKMLTYYLPSNAQVFNESEFYTKNTYSYVETSFGTGRKVPDTLSQDVWSYRYVGYYKKEGSSYLEIGPYHTDGIYTLTFTQILVDKSATNSDIIPNTVYTSYNISSQEAILSTVQVHLPHVKKYVSTNYKWEQAFGYITSTEVINDSGYGAYKIIDYIEPPIYSEVYQYAGPNQELVTFDYVTSSSTMIYLDQGIRFSVNLDESSYLISQGASLVNEGVPLETDATIPYAVGIYDTLVDASTLVEIDSITNHYGSVRVFSSSYDVLDSESYQDYEIRIIRTEDEGLTGFMSLTINGVSDVPTYTTFRDLTASQGIHYVSDGTLGVMRIQYQTINMADGYSVLPMVEVFDNNTGVKLHTSLYKLGLGSVVNTNSFDNAEGSFGAGSVTIEFEVTDLLPTGSYRMELVISADETAVIHFDKIMSGDSSVIEFIYREEIIAPLSNTYVSMIPYGIFYDMNDDSTNIVNFTNLSTTIDVYDEDLQGLWIPDYLDDMDISPFSTLESVDLTISMLDSYRHQYAITYHLLSESGLASTFIHLLQEYELDTEPEHVYHNGGEVEIPFLEHEISYMESPTLRVEYAVENLYITELIHTETTSTMIPLDEITSVLGLDYFINMLPGIGYEIEFNQDVAEGYYLFNTVYSNAIVLWGQSLIWEFEFSELTFRKIKNDESLLKNITFISDTIYAGFNTIMDYQLITAESYLGYFENPETRTMTILPTRGIYYGDYESENEFWIVGQVQKTNLTYYQPNFNLPNGSIIRRVTDLNQVHYSYQSEILNTDFTPVSDTILFVQYRIYASDYDENLDHYTDYYVAVQDITNNIRVHLEIANNSSLDVDQLFVRLNICQLELGYSGVCAFNDILFSMSSHIVFDALSQTYLNNQYQMTTYGTYVLEVSLPEGFTYTVSLQGTLVDGHSFYLENSILPKKYYIIITIIEDTTVDEWGQQVIIDYQPE